MRTRRNSKLWLAALLVLSTACGDDKKDDDGGGNTGGNDDAGNSNGGEDGGGDPFAASCKAGGLYDGFKASDIKGKLGTGACTTDKEVLEVCAVNPSTPAADAGGKCFLNQKKDEDLRTCTIEGDSGLGIVGLRESAPDLTDACLDCYAESVACSAEAGCGAACVTAPTGDACVKCREDAGCTPTFYACSGLPRAEDL